MIDIETLGLRPGSYIPTIGYAYFDWTGIRDSGTIAINIEYWSAAKADPSTIKFWLEQHRDAIRSTFFRNPDEQVTWVEAMLTLKQKVELGQKFGEGIWANGPLFDLAHLEHWYDQISEKPWSHRAPRDCRTLFEVAERCTGWDRNEATERVKIGRPELVAHDAEHDAILQALLVIDAYRWLQQRNAAG
jgi:hypothetical protein